MTDPKIIVALDFPQAAPALALVQRLEPALCRLKVGKELFTSAGPQLVEQLQQRGFEVFLDLKFHDIPNTTAQACKAAAALGVWMVNVHALGGKRMMEAAREALENVAQRPKLIAVTMLTSMAQDDLHGIGINASPAQMVRALRNWRTIADWMAWCAPRRKPLCCASNMARISVWSRPASALRMPQSMTSRAS